MPDRRRLPGGWSRYPGYDVLSKLSGPSWNEQTRRVITRRLAIGPMPRFFTREEFRMVAAIAARIVPQPATRAPIPVPALVDDKLHCGTMDGYRLSGMPRDGEAWRLGLKALQADAKMAYGKAFEELPESLQDLLLQRMAAGELKAPDWGEMRSKDFFEKRMARDIVLAYYSHPTAWSEIGWGGPASPRGYVRLDFDERDPWEAAEADGADDIAVRRINHHVR
jgi:Gluconate 2-dehydrogenase subunit 3